MYPRYRAEVGDLIGQVAETVEGAAAVQAHGQERARLDTLRRANGRVTDRYMDGTSMRNRFYASITLTRVVATALVLVVASLLAAEGALSVGTAAAGVLAVSTVFGPLAWLTELIDDLLSARAALDRVVGAAQVAEPAGGGAALPERGGVELAGVTFGYLPGRPVLTGVDLVVPPGSRAAVVGPTGAGKSTLGRLVAGMAHPTEGTVRVGGVDLAGVGVRERRRRLVFLTQESWCVHDTLAGNLRLAAPDADEERLRAAVEALGLGPWVDGHPDGLDRPVGPGGNRLSTGERQLVAVLRVALSDPAVVVLDEATAVLDPETEALVGEALDRALADRTVLVIAHRPETADRCPLRIEVGGGTARIVQHDVFGQPYRVTPARRPPR